MGDREGEGDRGSQGLRAVLGIRELVFSGAVGPGERLTEIGLCERLGLSRTPVRAALLRLEQEGLLDPGPSGGHVVRAFSRADVFDALELRGLLEGAAARMAAERGPEAALLAEARAVLGTLDAILAPGPEAMDFQAYIEANQRFHDLLPRLSGSRVISREIERVTRMPFAGPSVFLTAQAEKVEFRATLPLGQAHHWAILEAIEGREGARAEALAREHARFARKNLKFVMEDARLAALVPGMKLVR